MKIQSYRSVLVLLKYGRDGPAIMTTAITNPASNESPSIIILLTHFARAELRRPRPNLLLARTESGPCVCLCDAFLREVREGENDIRQGQYRESRARQFAEQTVLRHTICGRDGLGLLLDLLKARESLINCGSSHFSILPEIRYRVESKVDANDGTLHFIG